MNKPNKKYKIDDRLEVSGWGGTDIGTVIDINWIFHSRIGEHCWGYKFDFEGDGPGLILSYIPEGYIKGHATKDSKPRIRDKDEIEIKSESWMI